MDRKLIFLLVVVVGVCVEAEGPFSFVNEGEQGDYIAEYGAIYRAIPFGSPDTIFQLAFFNTTPNAYTLAIRMGHWKHVDTMRFVWTPNRHHLISEKATLNFTSKGDLVLFDADGTLVWSTNTANKGVVGIELRSNGNMVNQFKIFKQQVLATKGKDIITVTFSNDLLQNLKGFHQRNFNCFLKRSLASIILLLFLPLGHTL